MKRRFLAVILAAMLSFGVVAGAAAQPENRGCQAFGQAIAASGQTGGHGELVSTVAQSEPGAVAASVQLGMGIYC
jgi:hypothetical protein